MQKNCQLPLATGGNLGGPNAGSGDALLTAYDTRVETHALTPHKKRALGRLA
jgi:hypothetical protein